MWNYTSKNISNCLPYSAITKTYFRDTLSYLLKNYSFKNSETIWKVYITRSLIIMIYKHDLKYNPKFFCYNIIKKEIEDTITYITNKVNLNIVQEILYSIIKLDLARDNINSHKDDIENIEESNNSSDDNSLNDNVKESDI